MADELQTDLIVRVIAEGFDKFASDMGTKVGGAAETTAKKIALLDQAKRKLNQTMRQMTYLMGGARIALGFIEQGFAFAAMEADKLGRVDVTTNIDEAKNALSGLADVLVQIPIGGRDFLQWVSDGAAGIANFAKMLGAFGIQAQLTLGIIDRETAIQQINALVTDEAAAKTQKLTDEKQQLADANREAAEAEKRLADAMKNIEGFKASRAAAQEAESSLRDLQMQIRRLREEQGKAKYSDQERAEAALDLRSAELDEADAEHQRWLAENALKDNLDPGQQEELTRAYDRATVAHERSIIALERARVAYDEARTATIDNSAAISDLQGQLEGEIAKFNQAEEAALKYARALGQANEVARLSRELGLPSHVIGQPEPRQHGGDFVAGGAYFFNESRMTAPETVIAQPGGGGNVLTSQQLQALLGGQNANQLSIGNINVNNGMDLANLRAILRQAMTS